LNSPPTFSPKINFFKFNEQYRKCNVAYASGSIQYYDINSPVELLTQIPEKPRFVIFNQIPLDNKIERNFYTLQNIFNQIVVNTVFSEKYFTKEMNAYGYTLKDQWKDYSANCNILNHEYNLPFYSGQFYQL
jgi:putative methyltransferase (TIGR04325 family)